ncbi:unnamed protein product [Ectocarpus sp. 12 AP-2014]
MDLHQAVRASDHERLAELVNDSANLSEKDGEGETALHLAAEKDSLIMTMLLLSKGAPVNAENSLGDTPLVTASLTACVPVMRALVGAGAKYTPRALDFVVDWGNTSEMTAGDRGTFRAGLRSSISGVIPTWILEQMTRFTRFVTGK